MILTVEYVRIYALACFLFTFFSLKTLTLFQQCGYKIDEFFDCLLSSNKREIWRLSIYSLTFVLGVVIFTFILQVNKIWVEISVLIFAFILVGNFFFSTKIIKYPKLTSRFMRIYIYSCFACGLAVALASVLLARYVNPIYRFLPLGVIPIFALLVVGIPLTFLKSTELREVQPLKAFEPILVTEFGITRVRRFLLFVNACAPISFTEDGMVNSASVEISFPVAFSTRQPSSTK